MLEDDVLDFLGSYARRGGLERFIVRAPFHAVGLQESRGFGLFGALNGNISHCMCRCALCKRLVELGVAAFGLVLLWRPRLERRGKLQ
jgi:hypothetical protein